MKGTRWKSRPLRAFLIRALAFLLPVAAAVVVAIVVAGVLPDPVGLLGHLAWWSAVLGSSFAALVLVDRLARKLLPLAVLLRLSLVFPDQAPSRFRIALRSWSTGLLRSQVADARARGLEDEPTRAAEFVLTLVAALGAHDRKTRGHAERTRAYTDLLAEELKLNPDDRERLRWAALLHDVGKMAIQADILNKDGHLEDIEWSEIRQHPADGYELSRPLHGFLAGWELTILHHHEKWDGSGYPTGLSGGDISYGARIVAVGDAFDAMTALRSYQPAMSSNAARQELAAAAGRQFDPLVVRAFLNLSMGSLRKVMGTVAFFSQLPFVGGIRRLGETAGLAASAVIGILGFAVIGAIPTPGVGFLGGSGGDVLAAGSVGPGGVVTVNIPEYVAEIDEAYLQPAPDSEGREFRSDAVDPGTISIVSEPGFGTAEVAGPNVVYTPGVGFGGSDTMRVGVCDTAAVCVVMPLTVTNDGVTLPVVVASGGLTGGGDEGAGVSGSSSTTVAPAEVGTTTTVVTSGAPATTLPPPSSTSTSSSTTSTAAPTTTTSTTPTTTTTSTTTTTTTTSTAGPTTTSTTTTSTTSTTTTTTTSTTTTTTTSTTTTTTTTTTTVPPAGPPDAVDDAAATDEDVAVRIRVLANDSDPDRDLDVASLAVVTAPTIGTATVAGSAVVYTPNHDVSGIDNLEYQVCDLGGRCDRATVTITITAVPDAPRPADDTAETFAGVEVSIDVLSNDTDPEDDLDPSTLAITTQPVAGAATVAGGVVVYTPLPTAEAGDAFEYQVCDLTGLCGSARVTVAVASRGVAPVAVADAAVTLEDTPVDIDVLANDVDADGNLDTASLRVISPPTSGDAAVASGLVAYTPGPDFSGTDTFTYEICDTARWCDSADVLVEVAPVNDTPVAVDDAITADRQSIVTIDVLGNDFDPDGEVIVIVAADPLSARGARVICVTECVYSAPVPWTGPDTFTYTITDRAGLRATATVTVTPTVADVVLYLQSAAAGDQQATPVLPLSEVVEPTNDDLPNYDSDRDDRPGLRLLGVDGGVGLQRAETDPAAYQIWSVTLDEEVVIKARGALGVWAATTGFEAGLRARFTAFLLDCAVPTVDGTECDEIAWGSVDRNPWTELAGSWQEGVIDFGALDVSIPAGHTFAIKLTVAGRNSDDDMHVAFDASDLQMVFSAVELAGG